MPARDGKWDHNTIAFFQFFYTEPNFLDDTHEFIVDVQIRTADCCSRYSQYNIVFRFNARIGNVIDFNPSRPVRSSGRRLALLSPVYWASGVPAR